MVNVWCFTSIFRFGNLLFHCHISFLLQTFLQCFLRFGNLSDLNKAVLPSAFACMKQSILLTKLYNNSVINTDCDQPLYVYLMNYLPFISCEGSWKCQSIRITVHETVYSAVKVTKLQLLLFILLFHMPICSR